MKYTFYLCTKDGDSIRDEYGNVKTIDVEAVSARIAVIVFSKLYPKYYSNDLLLLENKDDIMQK